MTVETRRVKELIDEVRFNTNNTDDNRFDDSRLIKFFNSAQRQIQKIIYNSNPVNSPFAEEYQIPLAAGVNAYDLPEDIFAVASVRNVTPVTFNGKATQALKHISLIEEITSVNDNIPLPATCEDFLMAFVERKINYVDSSKDISNSQIFTQEEKEELEGMFRQDLKEVLYPAIVDETYYN